MTKLLSVLLLIALAFGAIATFGSHHPSTPIIVAKQSFIAQTGAISATTLYTPDADGDFRVSVYIVGSSGTACAAGVFNWNDGLWSQQVQTPYGYAAVNSAGFTGFPIHSGASHAIQFSTVVSCTGTLTYNAYVSVEQMD